MTKRLVVFQETPCAIKMGKEDSTQLILVYPLPNNGTLWVENKTDSIIEIRIIDLLGRNITNFEVQPYDKVIKDLLPKGMLIVETIKLNSSSKQLIPVILNH